MPIVIKAQSNGALAPLIICDACGETLKWDKYGNTAYAHDMQNDADPHTLYYCHIGVCLDQMEERIKAVPGAFFGWNHLDRLLGDLVANYGISPIDLLQVVEDGP